MKKVLFIFPIILFVIFCNHACTNKNKTTAPEEAQIPAQPKTIEGSWELIESNHIKVTNYKQTKHLTNTHFTWSWANNEGIIGTNVVGKYQVKGDSIFEYLEMTSPGMLSFIGTTARIKFELNNDTLKLNGVMPNGLNYTETWIRVR